MNYIPFVDPHIMYSFTSSFGANAVAPTVAPTVAAKKKMEHDCIICQDKFSEEKMETRSCGHTTCRECDGEWRRQGSIVCTKVDVRDAEDRKQKVKKYHVSSTCPMCRAEDTYANFKLRSNESLAAELSIALGMLYRSNRTKLELTSPQRHRTAPPPRPAFQMDDLTRQVIDQLVAEGQIQGPAILAAVRAPVPAPIRAQVVPRPVPVPIAVAAVTPTPPRPVSVPLPMAAEPHHNYGLLPHPPARAAVRPRQPRNDICANGALFRCVTIKTKLKCPRCNVALCRSCKNQCPRCPIA